MSNEKLHYIKAVSNFLNSCGQVEYTYEQLPLAVQSAILDELRTLNAIMACPNVAKGFSALAKIVSRDENAFKRRVANAVRKREKRAKK